MTNVFVSYSHEQGEWVNGCLVPVLRAGGARVLIDWERFKAGTAVVGQMDKIQDQADVHLICLSADYLASDYCRHELQRAIARDPGFTRGLDGRIRRGLVVPIRLDAASWPAEIADPNPLYVDLYDATAVPNSWRLLLEPCRINLGTTAPMWLAARDEIVQYLRRGQSANLLTQHEGINGNPLSKTSLWNVCRRWRASICKSPAQIHVMDYLIAFSNG